MKRILGLDLGTNSIGWALIEIFKDGTKQIIKLGSRIVPMDGAEISNFKKGLPQTKNAQKREKRGIRAGNKRYKQRRNKLIYVLQKLGMLPEQIKLSRPFDNPLKIQKVNILPIEGGVEQLTAKEFMELKVRAIHGKVSLKEFGKILHKFNQLRGYAGGDDEEEIQDELDAVLGIKSDKKYPSQENRIQVFKVIKYSSTDEVEKKKKVFNLTVIDPDNQEWLGTTVIENLTVGDSLELKQTIRRNTKTGEITSLPKFSIPNKTGWRKKMENLEEALNKYSEEKGRKTYLSEYFLECLNENKWQRIRNNVILRSRYQEEFDVIWEAQKDHFDNIPQKTIEEIAHFLFPGTKETQIALRKDAIEKGLYHIIRNQIIFFQRELKDQSHLISECRFEEGEKAVANSHPLFQEYKIWEQINKLSINRRTQMDIRKNGKPKYKYEERAVSPTLKEYLFEELQKKKELSFGTVFKKLKELDEFVDGQDFFNGLSAKSKLVGNTTRITFEKRLGKYWNILNLESIENQTELWKLLYHGKGNEYDMESPRNKAIAGYLRKKSIEESANFDKIVVAISKIRFPRNYQSISLKVVEKVLPLVRAGKYYDNIIFSEELNSKILKLMNEEPTTPFEESLEVYLYENGSEKLVQGGFGNAHALMLVYGQHTAKEVSDDDLLESYNEIKALKRHSLRNPLVEQMINETLMVVKDIWKKYEKPNEIRVELARDLKNSKKEREKMHDSNEKSRKENEKIRVRLNELREEISKGNIEKYKLWKKQPNTSQEFLGKLEATKGEVEKMKLWDEQGYVDPYTGKPIPLSDLYNKGKYDVDHIIPQSRYFDDSLSNKVVCANSVNRDKGNRTTMEYFEAGSTKCEILSKEAFMENAVNKFYGKKRKLMLATKIPDDPIERQKKETQYIAIKVREELAKIVGSKNIKTSTGGLTHYLRNHWGITEVFKKLLKERFENYFELKATKAFDSFKGDDKKAVRYLKELIMSNLPENLQPDYFEEMSRLNAPLTREKFTELYINCHIFYSNNNLIIRGYSKRYDHRHHAMDALIVACTDEKAVKRLNDLNQHLQNWLKKNINRFDIDLQSGDGDILENFLQLEDEVRNKVVKDLDKFRSVEKPWDDFQKKAEEALSEIIVSHKPKDKLLVQYKEEKDKNGNITKTKEKTIRIRGALHEETIYGISSNAESYRIPLSKFTGSQFDTMGNIEKITNKFLRDIFRDYFVNTHSKNKSEAFSAEGIMGLNKQLAERTIIKNGKVEPAPHPPINSVRIYRKKVKKWTTSRSYLTKIR